MDILLGWCIGPVDAFSMIKANDIQITDAFYMSTVNETIRIRAPNAFGGDDKEGGVEGDLTVQMGADTQVVGATIKGTIGGNVSDMRGYLTTYYSGLICSNNPYPKPWKALVERALKGWFNDNPWYPNEAWIGLDSKTDATKFGMNPAHIIYECLTNPIWGRGFPPSFIDEPSFIDAANTLCDEGLGLNFAWSRATELDEFISIVINHMGAALYTDRITGLYALKLLRADYDRTLLPIFDYTSGLLSIEEDITTAPDTSHNELLVTYLDNKNGQKGQIRIQNLAGIQSSQSIASTSVDYLGVSTAELAARLGQRDMSIQAAGIRKFTLKMDRRGRKIQPGGVFRIAAPDRNIADMVLRVGSVEQGSLSDQTLTVKAMQDVFALESTSYIVTQVSTWQPPSHSADPPTLKRIDEINYRDVVRALAGNVSSVDETEGDPVAVALRPNGLSTNYILVSRTSVFDPWVDHGRFPWTPTATLAVGVGIYDTTLTLDNIVELASVQPTGIAWLEDELVEIVSIDSFFGTIDVRRGCVDSIPVNHSNGARIWFTENAMSADGIHYATGDVVLYGLETQTATDLAAPTSDTWTIVGRQGRPYPMGNLSINGIAFGYALDQPPTGDLVFDGADRNRLTQADHILAHEDGSVTKEAGTTYTYRFYDGVTLLRTVASLTSPAFTYDFAMYTADGAPPILRVEAESERSGLPSYFHYDFTINRTGAPLAWGFRWGANWGAP